MSALGPDQLLDEETHDLVFRDGDRVMETNLGQACKVSLLWYLGEWFLDTTQGVPYFQQVFTKPFRLPLAKSAMREALETTPGVLRVNSLQLDFVAATRSLGVTWAVTGEQGDVEGTQVVLA